MLRGIYTNAEKNWQLKAIGKQVLWRQETVANSLSHFRFSLITLLKNTNCNQVLQKHLIRCFWKTWWQLQSWTNYSEQIREVQ